jgi:glutamate racemase
MNRNPIGIFDSGIGGLTVVKAVNRVLPGESVIYFGDTARVPYGSKSPETVIRFAMENASFLMKQDIKLLVVACNTASSVSLPSLRETFDVPVTGVIEPGAGAAAAVPGTMVIGVIGTLGTISSGAYQKALKTAGFTGRMIAQPCPMLVPLVEEGWLEGEITKMVIREYTDPLVREKIDTLVLGCTHYPLLKPVISEVLGTGLTLIDSADETAITVARMLEERDLLSDEDGGRNRFYVSDIPLKFQEMAQRFLGRAIPLVTQIEAGEDR